MAGFSRGPKEFGLGPNTIAEIGGIRGDSLDFVELTMAFEHAWPQDGSPGVAMEEPPRRLLLEPDWPGTRQWLAKNLGRTEDEVDRMRERVELAMAIEEVLERINR